MRLQRNLVIPGVGLVVLIAVLYLVWGGGDDDQAEKYLKVEVERGDVRRTVTSTGTLQAVVTVQVGSQVSGRIQELHADFNSVVKKGQTLAIIDPANFEAQRDRAAASLATSEAAVKNAEANLINRKAELQSAEANLQVSRVDRQEAGRQLRRAKGLFEDGLIPERDLETAQAGHDQSAARLLQAEAQISQIKASIRSAGAQKEQALANVKQAKAELKMAQVNLYYTNITSPIDGVVIERSVDIGQTVAASFQAPILFLIANDLAKMQVIAQIDEADIGAISEQAEVDFTVDAFPGQNFQGKISEIRLSSKLPGSSTEAQQAAGSTNVVVYNVMIDVDNPQLKLRPAMTATVTFTVASAEDVLKVANVALRYRPSDKTPEEIQAMLGDGPPGSGDGRAAAGRPGGGDNQARSGGGSGMDPERMRAMRARMAQGGGGRGFGGRGGGRGMDPERMRAIRARMAQGGGGGPFGGGGPGMRRGGPAGDGARTVIAPAIQTQYGINPGLKIRFPQAERARSRRGMLWVLGSEGQPEPRRVRFGITDGRDTAILGGNLEAGEEVITGEMEGRARASSTSSPFGGLFGSRRRAPQRSQQSRRGGSR